MSLIGIIGKKKSIQLIKNETNNIESKIIQLNKESIKNLKNIKFNEIIFMEDIEIDQQEYKYFEELINRVNYLIINADIRIEILSKISINIPIKLITYGFNPKSTITISSIKEEKIIVSIQRELISANNKKIEIQEKEIDISQKKDKKVYTNLVVFIIKQLHNL